MNKNEIYDKLSMLLTDYEEDNNSVSKTDFYNMLVLIQNNWEDTITSCDN